MPPRRRKNSDDESADEGSGSDSDAFVPHNYVKASASPANEKPARARRAVKSYKETARSDGEVVSSARSSGDDDGDSAGSGDDNVEDVGPSVELFVARRGSASQDVDARTGPFEYLVKWRKLSYKHVTWQTEEELLELPGAMKTRLTRFNAKWDQRIRDHECALCPRLA